MGTNPDSQRRGIGSELVNFIRRNLTRKLVTWSDINSEEFYRKMSFSKQKNMGYKLQKYFGWYSHSVFYVAGFKKNEINILKNSN